MLMSFSSYNFVFHLVGKHNSFVYRRVAYGGLDGMYYTCSEGRVTGGDGVSAEILTEVSYSLVGFGN